MTSKKLYMRHTLDKQQNYPLPNGFYFDLFKDENDIEKWADVLLKAKEFPTKELALNRFKSEFHPYLSATKERMLFIKTTDDKVVGTATAWCGVLDGKMTGRLHWVALIPDYQSQGLGRPLIAEAMSVLKVLHKEAYLTTQPRNMVAIHLYLAFGWTPLRDSKQQIEAWDMLPYHT